MNFGDKKSLKQLQSFDFKVFAMDEIEASLIICHAPKLSQTKMRVLVDHFGCARDALHAICTKSPLPFQLSSETEYYFLTLEKQKAWQEDLREAEKQNCTLFSYT